MIFTKDFDFIGFFFDGFLVILLIFLKISLQIHEFFPGYFSTPHRGQLLFVSNLMSSFIIKQRGKWDVNHASVNFYPGLFFFLSLPLAVGDKCVRPPGQEARPGRELAV